MKKLNRILSLSAAAALALSLTACSGGPSGTADTPAGGSSNTPAAGETYKVAVIKQMDHASLDEIANAITARLDAIAEENGITIEYEVTSGQGDQTVLRQLSDQAIADGVDAVFTPTDNIIMAAELAIYEDFIAVGIPHYTGADSFVRNGAFATCGVNYTDLGAETADLAYQAMTGGMDGLEDYYQVAGGLITVNSETAEALAIDPAVFESLGQVTTVTTTED